MQENQSAGGIPAEYQQIQKIVQDFKRVISYNLRSNEGHLVQQLEEKARKLKQSIDFYKRQTSNENIQKLISKKRHEKESQRLQLQIQWRNLTQKYKKLQQQQKKINQQNRQSKFDVENLQNKIIQLKNENKLLQKKIDNLKLEVQNSHFITEPKQNYNSPYKFNPVFSEKINEKRKQITKIKYTLENHPKILLKLKQSQKENQEFKIFNDQNKHLFDPTLPTKESLSYGIKQKKQKHTQQRFNQKDDKWTQLIKYLDKPQIRQKVFELIRRQT